MLLNTLLFSTQKRVWKLQDLTIANHLPTSETRNEMAKEIPLELLALFAKALKQTGEATLLELLLTSKAVFSMCEVKLLRELDIMAGKEGMRSLGLI